MGKVCFNEIFAVLYLIVNGFSFFRKFWFSAVDSNIHEDHLNKAYRGSLRKITIFYLNRISFSEVILLKIVIRNEKEAREFLGEIQGYLIAELMYTKLLQQPEPLRRLIYNKLIEEQNPD